ncbi:ABC transporter ATP-binding protein [Pseudonocardia xishanensis]|uniref:ABC transporter ATP-binding protein n=1 Tax=Pseudonocardia xishanensis TaxID=630995 RepID=UPI0031EC7BF3
MNVGHTQCPTTLSEPPSAGEIDIVGVSVEFRDRTRRGRTLTALTDVSLQIARGQFVALVGASGCGKTTLLNLLAGELRPTAGQVLVGGRPVDRPLPTTGYMLARDGLLPWRSVRSNVELGLEHRRTNRTERSERAQDLLQLVGLGDFADAYPRQLSQGMRQRAAIARTLATEPELLLMDEPFAALDARTKLSLQREFLRIWETESPERRRTVVFVTHDLQEALLLADRLVVMLPRPGRVAVDRTIDLPRPRSTELSRILFTEEFRRNYQNLFEVLEGDVDPDRDLAVEQ